MQDNMIRLLQRYDDTPMREWRNTQYNNYIDTIQHELSLTKTEKEKIKHIIKKTGLKQLYKNATAEQIILALTIFIKEEESGQTVKIERYKIYNDNNIDYRFYSRVLRNLLIYYRQRLPVLVG